MDIRSPTPRSRSRFEEQKKQWFPKEADYQKFLKDSGQTEEDIMLARQARPAVEQDPRQDRQGQGQGHRRRDPGVLRQEQGALRPARAARPADRPDEERGARRTRPRRRSRAASRWKGVAKKYSIDEASKGRAASCPAHQGLAREALDKAVFGAKKGKVVGPVKTQFGYYVFEVDKVKTARAADARAGEGDDQPDAAVAEPAEGARQVRQGLPKKWKEQDGVPRRAT